MSAEIFNNILRQYGESISRVSKMIRDPAEFVEPEFQVYHPHHTGLIGRGATEEEANADLQAQVDEIRDEHYRFLVRLWRWELQFPFKACDCIICRG